MAKQKVQRHQVGQVSASPLMRGLLGERQMRQEGQHSLKFIPIGEVAADGSVAMGLDIGNAPIPARRYAAELCSVSYTAQEVKFIFAQPFLVGDGVDSAVVIRMNPQSVMNLADSLRNLTEPNLQDAQRLMGFPDETLSEIGSQPVQIVSMFASIVAIAFSGFDTCLDFYQASAFAVRKSEISHSLEVEPVVRVEMRTALFVPLTRRLMEIDGEFRKIYKFAEG